MTDWSRHHETCAVCAVLSALLPVTGCLLEGSGGRSVSDAWEEPPARRGAALEDWDDQRGGARESYGGPLPIATVNKRPISRKDMLTLLVRTHGLSVLEQLIALELVRQAAEARGISITPANIQAEYDRALSRISSPVPTTTQPDLAKDAREALLDQILLRRGLTREEFKLAMERQAYLRKIAAKHLKITDDQLHEQFEMMYAERVQVRHIQLRNLRDAKGVQALLAAGHDFAEVAKTHSQNPVTAADGGLLPPFSRTQDDVPAAFRDAAFALKLNEVSNPIRVDADYHVIKPIERFPKSKVQFEHVKEIVRVRLTERLLPDAMARIELDLFEEARNRIVITDPDLKKQFDDRHKLRAAKSAGDRK